MRPHPLTSLLITGTALSLSSPAQEALPPLPAQTDSGSATVQTSPGGAQVSFSAPAQTASDPSPAPAAQQGNCKLMASNTVRVIYRGIVETGWGASPAAHFIVIENLAHKSYAPEGDAALAPGTLVGVELRRDIPGQPAGVVDAILSMRPGEEALMRMDHLYMLDPANYGNLRVCGRFQARMSAPAAQSTSGAVPYGLNPPAAPANQPTSARSHAPAATAPGISTPAATGSTTGSSGEVATKWEVDSQGHVRERIFVNGEEVKPPTLETAVPQQTPPADQTSPATAPSSPSPAVPDRVIPEDSSGDDTVIETPTQPAPQAPTQASGTAPDSPATTPAPSGSRTEYDPTQDSF